MQCQRLLAGCFLLFLMAMTVSANALDLSGKVTLPDGRPATQAVVYLDGGASAVPASHIMVDQRNKTFIPHVSVIPAGTSVRFPNNDTVFHNVFAYYQAKKFDLGMYPRGASKSVTFDKPGLVALLCNVHSQMSAYIMVVDTPYYAVTDSRGLFHVPHVAAGVYTLHAWHESGATQSQSVTVDSSQDALAVALRK